jgi:iron complex outermembrane recepter protein
VNKHCLSRVANRTALSIAIASIVNIPLAVSAQTATPPPAANQGSAAASESQTLETVVVTARKRAEPAQTAPLAITPFSAETLERAKIAGAADLQFSIPNAVLTGNDRFTIRGIGNASLGGDNGVGASLNGASVNHLPQDDLFDMERIEVLRGPQGTLFGRNTTGGAVAVYTKKPTAIFGGHVSMEVGNYGALRPGFALNIPINDSLRQRFAGYSLRRDGFTFNEATGNSVDNRDQYSVRSSTRLLIGDNASADLVIGSYRENSNRTRETKRQCKAIPVLGCSPLELGFDSPNYDATIFRSLAGPLTGLGFLKPGSNIYAGAPNPADPRRIAADTDATFVLSQDFATLDLSYDINNITFAYVGGYSKFATEQNTDWDNAALPFRFAKPITYSAGRDRIVTTDELLTSDSFVGRSTTTSHELRAVSSFKGPLNFTAGLYQLDSKGSGGFFIWHPFFELIQKIQNRPPETWFVNGETKRSSTKANAVFGEMQYKFNNDLRATLGARYTTEEKYGLARNIVLTNTVPFRESTQKWEWGTYRGSVDYAINKDMFAYATIATGYKGGGFNTANAAKPTFEPETVTAYEAGLKNTLLGGLMRANFTVFHNDYKNMQLGQRIAGAAITSNADAITQGAEAEVQFAPSRNLLLDANVSVLKTKIGSFLTSDAANPGQSLTTKTPEVIINLQGNKLPYAPAFKAKVGVQYSMPLFNTGWKTTARLDYVWQDKMYAREFNTPTDLIKAWGIANLQVRFLNAKENIEVKTFVKNLRNSDPVTSIIIEDALIGSYRNVRYLDPRTYGLQIEYRF